MVFHVKQLSSDAKQGALLREGHTYEGSPSLNAADSPAMPACQWALAYLMCWGVDLPFDEQCRSLLDLSEPLPQVICGVRGHSGLLSFLTPGAHHALGHHRAHLGMQYHRWRSSAHLTALHSIAAVALSNALMMCPGNDDLRNVCSGLVTHFSVVIPERLPGFCAPSLSLLARHYIDAVEYVQQSARSLMEGTLQRMSVEVPGVVETSNNLGVVSLENGRFHLCALVRSLRDSATMDLAERFTALFELIGARTRVENGYPGWAPNPDSPLLATFKARHAALMGHEPEVKVIHAGLECGILGSKRT